MIPDWQKCDDHGGYGFKRDCLLCKAELLNPDREKIQEAIVVMNDAELIEKLQTALEYELINGHVYKPNVAAVKAAINMVREHDYDNHEVLQKWKQDISLEERAKTIKACLEAVAELNAVIAAGGKLLLKEDVLQAIKGVGDG